MSSLFLDLRFALRMFLRRPGFSLAASATLALGVGANVTIFALVHSVLLRPLPYHDPDRLALIYEADGPGDDERDVVSPGNFLAIGAQTESFESLAALTQEIGGFALTGLDRPSKLDGLRVTWEFFETLGIGPRIGRGFLPDDDRPGAPPTVILTEGLWLSRFGADREILGSKLMLNGEPHEVIGISPKGLALPVEGIDLFVPFRLPDGQENNYRSRYLTVIGRLRPGTTLASAREELESLSANLARDRSGVSEDWRLGAASLHQSIVAGRREALLALFGVVGLVFLIACANVSGLFLAQSKARENEMAVRRALGAGAGRLLRQLACEGLTIAATAGALGFLISAWGTELLQTLGMLDLPRAFAVRIDSTVVVFALLTAATGGVLSVALPALQVIRPGLAAALSGGDRGRVATRPRLQKALVVGEVALTLIALTGAGLLLNSFVRLVSVKPGFETERVLTLQFSLVGPRYGDAAARSNFYRRLEETAAALPGVEAAGVVNFLPLRFHGGTLGYSVEGRPRPADQWQGAAYRVAGPGYLRALNPTLLAGRFYSASEIESNPRVAVIDEQVARAGWPDGNPIGGRLKFGKPTSRQPWLEVVGVVASGRLFDLSRPVPAIYVPYTQDHGQWASPRSLAARTSGHPEDLRKSLEKAIWGIDPDVAVSNVDTMQGVVSGAISPRRGQAFAVGGLAAIALLLAAVGVYAVISFGVGQRAREIGIRMALGARPDRILWGVLLEGAGLLLIGLGVGTVGSWLLGGLLQNQLYQVRAGDAPTRLAVVLILAAATLAACWGPARRATRVDPTVALRAE